MWAVVNKVLRRKKKKKSGANMHYQNERERERGLDLVAASRLHTPKSLGV